MCFPSSFLALPRLNHSAIRVLQVKALVANGSMDGWVDQSWAGAWENVAPRHTLSLGWTYQLGYILAHRAMVEAGNRARPAQLPWCRHYTLHGTFDAYEDWSTINTAPGSLRWGLWAYSAAAYDNGTGLQLSDGQVRLRVPQVLALSASVSFTSPFLLLSSVPIPPATPPPPLSCPVHQLAQQLERCLHGSLRQQPPWPDGRRRGRISRRRR